MTRGRGRVLTTPRLRAFRVWPWGAVFAFELAMFVVSPGWFTAAWTVVCGLAFFYFTALWWVDR